MDRESRDYLRHVKTQKWLKGWYNYANRTYFGKKLPNNLQVRWAVLSDLDMGWQLDDTIVISEELQRWPAIAQLVMLHEMVHVKTGGYHGKRFQNEMLRLAKAGAMKDLW